MNRSSARMPVKVFVHLVLAIFLCVSGGRTFAQNKAEISRTAPKQVEGYLKELVGWEKAKALPKVLLSEELDDPEKEIWIRHVFKRVQEDGSSITLSHRITELLAESGKEELSTDTWKYRPDREILHVLRARTILPDGEILDVGDEAMFVEEPEGDSEILFDDYKQLRMVFPKIEVGALVETVVVRERLPTMPGHWSASTLWNTLDPVRSMKWVVDCPNEFADSLVWDLPRVDASPVREKAVEGDSLTRFRIEGTSIKPLRFQLAMPHFWQRGPYLRVGNGQHWDRFAEWYAGLLAERDGDGKKNDRESGLDALSRKWAGDAEAPREIAARLFERVSREIRYTGLEFGQGAYQPRNPKVVHETGYGDCKDKSNLLRVLLARHGIESRLALVSTYFPGEVPRKIADTNLFNHAILAVDLPGAEEPIFCDPTMNGVPFGVMTQQLAGSEALLIALDGSFEWAKISQVPSGSISMTCDLEIEPTGAYSGWVDVQVAGATGWLLRRHYENLERAPLLQDSIRRFLGFFPGVRVVDAAPVEADGDAGKKAETETEAGDGEAPPFHYRYYVLQDVASLDASEKTSRISFPAERSLLTAVGPNERRVHPFVVIEHRAQVDATIRLPEGWEILDQPAELDLDGKGFQFRASWSLKDDDESVLRAEATMERTVREFSPRQHKSLAEAVRGLVSWLTTPVLVRRASGKGEAEDDDHWAVEADALPRMPTVEGFSALIQERFPFDPKQPFAADHDQRGVAFQRMGEFYPDNDKAQFTSQMMPSVGRLLSIVDEDQAAKIARRLQRTAAEFEGRVEPVDIAGAELIIAIALDAAGKAEPARELFESLFKREEVPEVIHQAAAGMLAIAVAEEDPVRAAELAALAIRNDLMPDDERSGLVGLLLDCKARLPGMTAKELRAEMVRLLAEVSELEDDLRTVFVEGPSLLVDYGHHDEAERYRQALTAGKRELGLSDEDLEPVEKLFASLKKVRPLHRKLKAHLDEHPWPDLAKLEEGDLIECASDCFAFYGLSSEVEFRYLLRGLVLYGPQVDFADRCMDLHIQADLWFSGSDSAEPSEEVVAPPNDIESLLDLTLELWRHSPSGDYSSAEDAESAGGDLVLRRDGERAAVEYYEKRCANKSISDDNRLAFAWELIGLFESLDDLEGFLGALEHFENVADAEERGVMVMRVGAAYVCLAEDRRQEAWKRFEQVAEEADADELPGDSLRLVSGFVDDKRAANAWWDASADWWPMWSDALAAMPMNDEMETAWSDYEPWNKITNKAARKTVAIESKKKRQRQLAKKLAQQMEFVRWHRQGVDSAIHLLDSAAADFPEQGEALQEITEALRSASIMDDAPAVAEPE